MRATIDFEAGAEVVRCATACEKSRRSFFCDQPLPSWSASPSSRSGGVSGSGLGAMFFTQSRHCFSVKLASLRSNTNGCAE